MSTINSTRIVLNPTQKQFFEIVGNNETTVIVRVLEDGTLSFEGNSGQLFSITDSLSGTIFSVNDISGIPSIEVLDDGTVRLAEYGGIVTVTSPSISDTKGVANITYSTSQPSGGSDGDVWFTYTP